MAALGKGGTGSFYPHLWVLFRIALQPVDAGPLGAHCGEQMLYDAYEMQRSFLAGASTLANIGAGWMQNPANPFAYSGMGPIVASALDVFAHASAARGKPVFGLKTTLVDDKEVAVHEEVVLSKPF